MKKLTLFAIIAVMFGLSVILLGSGAPPGQVVWSGKSLSWNRYEENEEEDVYRGTKSVSFNSGWHNVQVSWNVPEVDGEAPSHVAVNIDDGEFGTAYDSNGGCTGTLWLWDVPTGSHTVKIDIFYPTDDVNVPKSSICCWGGQTGNTN